MILLCQKVGAMYTLSIMDELLRKGKPFQMFIFIVLWGIYESLQLCLSTSYPNFNLNVFTLFQVLVILPEARCFDFDA